MENFIAYNPTKVHFGKGVTDKVGETAAKYGKNVLLIYGKGSVVRNGYHEIITKSLSQAGADIVEYSGIKPNPVVEDADAAAEIARTHNADVIVALGGGSVIDSAKIVSAAACTDKAAWDIMKNNVKITKTIPLIAVLTLAATGTEMNAFAVLQNHRVNEKIGWGCELSFPNHSFLNPEFTYSVPRKYTAFGIVDLIAHSFENFFGKGQAPLTDRITTAIISEAMHYAKPVLKEPDNYEYRANILWQSTLALNGSTTHGRISGDWGVHGIGHILSVLFDTPHGASLSIVYPAWFKLQKKRIPERISKLSDLLFGNPDIDYFITKIEDFFIGIGSPVSLQDAGIQEDKRKQILNLLEEKQIAGIYHKFSQEDYRKLLDYMYR